MLQELPLCLRVVCEAHRVLLDGVRGRDMAPGKLRRVPNWIGRPGSTIENATYVPIDAEELPDAIGRWEQYMHEDVPDRLVQLAILHAEFEALHPFLDGNGRLGRMLVPLFLWQQGLIRQPVFYISGYFEERRDVYYEGLLSVSRDDDWTGWTRFFLEAVQAQAEDNLEKAMGILGLYESMKLRVAEMTRSPYAIHALDWIFEHPIFLGANFATETGIAERTGRRIMDVLCQGGILRVLRPKSGRRAAVFAFPELLNTVEGREVL